MFFITPPNFLTSLGPFLLLMLFFLFIHGDGSTTSACRKEEHMALLRLKAEFVDDYARLSSWGPTNCCEWKGVVCDNRTNHVVALDLHLSDRYELQDHPAAPLRGKISASLLQLSNLQYLDLSHNDFGGAALPNFIGSLSKLRHLNLSNANLGGLIPPHLGNLSALRLLDLGGNQLRSDTNLDWLSALRSLQYLDLSYATLNESTTWLHAIHQLTALREIHLYYCYLPTPAYPISLPSLNSSNSLLVLDLSFNSFKDSSAVLNTFLNMSSSFTYIDFSGNSFIKGRICDSLGNLMSLSHLDLQSTNLHGSISDVVWNLTSLSYLDLSNNDLHGEFPQPLKNLSSLTYLNLSFNQLNGQLSHLLSWLWDSTDLQYISLTQNLLFGSFPNMSRYSLLSEIHLGNNLLSGQLLEDSIRLPILEQLDLSTNKLTGGLPDLSSSPLLTVLVLFKNSLSGSISENMAKHSKIEYLDLGDNRLEGLITEDHISSLPQLTGLDLSFNLNIRIRINPSWVHPVKFGGLMLADCNLGPHFPKWLQTQNQLQRLDVSNSGIVDTIPSWFWGNMLMCSYLNMSHNHIHGVLPDLSSNLLDLITIDLSSNEFRGPLPPMPPLVYNVDFSGNKFAGSILNFCNFKEIDLFLDLSNNQLSGEIPQDCFMNLLSLAYVNLANNNFSGEIPPTTNLPCRVFSLHLHNNCFRGRIPGCLMNCSAMTILDLGENEFSGIIPEWFGERMPKLGVLVLKSNMLYGSLPSSICHLSNLQVLDISSNKITGNIPRCLNNFTLLSSDTDPDSWKYLFHTTRNAAYDNSFQDSVSVIWKGLEQTYINTLGLLKMIDLSSNELSGNIPLELTSLIGLVGLNLSRNNLVGSIPAHIDQLRNLNFLDLSRNNLSGSIPPTLSKLSHLGVLDLSFNNLWGKIPWDAHMQTFGAPTYLGNPRLCGPPLLSRPCPHPNNGTDDSKEDDEEKFITKGFYISMVVGFIVAFWVVFWTLLFSKWWTRICTTVADWFYVKVLVNKRRFFNNA